MPTTKKYDLAVKVGEYTDNQGQTKSRYQNVGAMMQKDDGGTFLMLARWFNPAGVPDFSGKNSESILVNMFDPRQSAQQSAPAPQRSAPTSAPEIDDIPF